MKKQEKRDNGKEKGKMSAKGGTGVHKTKRMRGGGDKYWRFARA